MVLTPHIVTGAFLGYQIDNPYLIASSALVLHFALDILPHGDYLSKKSTYREFWKVALDLLIGFGLIFFIISQKNITDLDLLINIFIGISFSLLPDFTTFLHWKLGIQFLKPIYDFHKRLHIYPDFSPKRQFRLRNNWPEIVLSLLLITFVLIS